ncbi:hypothetical protein CAP48_18690 [Advenella sp. S44]|uniref:META domain-containing protein n=1 Tax=Advenella sp. S44 TaxID=1982755 RepID=UPI000C2A7F35|nr:META domain-containing protein [Advenella sp. S44]PJX20431.1 hypothetical protein CAP48_18690 [Advenella sp. S44]
MIHPLLRTLLAMTCVIGSYATAASLQATAAYRERIAAPADAILEARLQQMQADGTPGQVVGHAALNPAGQTPFHFSIVYDDHAVKPGLPYRISVLLTAQGRTLFSGSAPITLDQTGDKPVRIMMTQGASQEAAAPAVSSDAHSEASPDVSTDASAAKSPTAESTAKPDSPLRNTYWKLVSLNGKAIQTQSQQREAHIVFSAEGNRLSGNSGCNRMMGGFEENGEQLKLTQIGGTRMACPPGVVMETEFTQTLLTVARYQIRAEHLDLLNANGDIVAGFEAVALY